MVPEKTIPSSTLEAPVLAVLLLGTVRASSEADGHAIELAFDHDHGTGATHWKAGEPGEQTITVAFEQRCTVEQVSMEVEEREVARTQEVLLAVSTDGGLTYRELVRQEFCFSPEGATWEEETWRVQQEHVSHVRLVMKPDKGRKDVCATLTSFVLRGYKDSMPHSSPATASQGSPNTDT
jgi:hypothetical protein